MDISIAIKSVIGTSEIADDLLRKRYPDEYEKIISESANSEDKPQEEEHDKIVGEVLKGEYRTPNKETVRKLSHVILQLTERVESLEGLMETKDLEEGDNIDDDTIAKQRSEFRNKISESRIGDLWHYYNENFFKSLKYQKTRVMIAQELLDHASANNKEPSQVWQTILANGGKI